MAQTVLARSGGFARVRHVVAAIYDKALDHEMLQRHFMNVDMARLIDHQTKMITGIMDGDSAFDDDTLRRAHARLGVTAPEFDEMGRILRETLEDFAFPPHDVDHVCQEFARRRHLVVAT
ncbi:MAG: group 1 truncated hemoglobin [Enhydrobacter sp.]|nr:MAG: group 1 truncated hemoglobin [Enhydrobacter sp.]